jgi:hypothetical protein
MQIKIDFFTFIQRVLYPSGKGELQAASQPCILWREPGMKCRRRSVEAIQITKNHSPRGGYQNARST